MIDFIIFLYASSVGVSYYLVDKKMKEKGKKTTVGNKLLISLFSPVVLKNYFSENKNLLK